MTLNLDLIGKKTESIPFTYDQDAVILYAFGIGAGVEELDFVYEKNLKVFPTFGVLPYMPALTTLMADAGLNLPTVLHGEQKIVLHHQPAISGTIHSRGMWNSVYDKGDKGAVLNIDFETKDEQGQLLFENRVVIMDRSAGNFGGDRGPKSERFDPPQGKDPDFRVEYKTSPDQAALYRLNGDKNPLHVDPEFAKLGGLEGPILHGLCTYGFAGRAILHNICGSDPARFKSFSARFVGVVFPGDTLITEGWEVDGGKYIVRTMNQDGNLVLGNGMAELS
jgi:acyl dehydratase